MSYNKQKHWKQKTEFEQSPSRQQYKREWARIKRLKAKVNVGSAIDFQLVLFGTPQIVSGVVKILDQPKGTVTIAWHYETLSGLVQLPLSKLL